MPEKNTQESKSDGKVKSWVQENMRILVSIVIVIAIAGGVYSYSQRSIETEKPSEIAEFVEDESVMEEDIFMEEPSANEGEISPVADQATEEVSQPEQQPKQEEDRVSSATTSQETEGSFIETAGAGDGLTHLARRSLANYLEKNPDSSLTPEHKIYIEDYLRKNVGYNKGIRVGTSVEFSKGLIQEAISKARGLNEKQLQNLHKYAVRVPSLS